MIGYTERGAADWVLRVLTERQFKILDYAFSHLVPLEDPRIEEGTILAMTDLAVVSGLNQPYERNYLYRVTAGGRELASGKMELPRLDLEGVAKDVPKDDPFLTVTWSIEGSDPETDVHLRVLENSLLPVAMTRRE
jgi:hypothetical protein